MKKKVLLSLLLIAVTLLNGCDRSTTEDQTDSSTSYMTDMTEIPVSENDFVEEYSLFNLPHIYMQDYSNIYYGHSKNMAENGTQITALSIIESGYAGKLITPDDFLAKYSNLMNENDVFNVEELSEMIVKEYDGSFARSTFDLEELANELKNNYAAFALVRIPHPSIFGKDSAYLIITGITADGYFIVYDPNKNNIQQYSNENSAGFIEYSVAEVVYALGIDADMYIYY